MYKQLLNDILKHKQIRYTCKVYPKICNIIFRNSVKLYPIQIKNFCVSSNHFTIKYNLINSKQKCIYFSSASNTFFNKDNFSQRLIDVLNKLNEINEKKIFKKTSSIGTSSVYIANCFSFIFEKIEKDETKPLIFEYLVIDCDFWFYFIDLSLNNIKHFSANNDFINFNQNEKTKINQFLVTKLIACMHEKQTSHVRENNFKNETLYYNLSKSFISYLKARNDLKVTVLEIYLKILIMHYFILLKTRDNSVFDNEIVNEFEQCVEFLLLKLPNKLKLNLNFSLTWSILQGMLFTRSKRTIAFDSLEKNFSSEWKNNRAEKSIIEAEKLFQNYLIASIIGSNDLNTYESVISKIVMYNDYFYPSLPLVKLSNETNQILFRNLISNHINRDVNILFNSWFQTNYIPNVYVINDMKTWFQKHSLDANNKYRLFDTEIDKK